MMAQRAFTTAGEVKAFLREQGFTEKVKVKGETSIFSGNLFFSVSLPERGAVNGVVESFGSREPLRFGCFEDASEATHAKVAALTVLSVVLKHTNAAAGLK